MHQEHHHRRGMRHGGHDGISPRFTGRGGGRRRVFDSGELRLVLLKLIEEQARHGYDLIREIETRTGGAYVPSPGIIYPTLTLLLEMELIGEERADGARKLFSITDTGRIHLAERQAEVLAAMARLEALARISERTDAAPIQRAMRNLKTTIYNRLSQENADKQVLLDVADFIDEAARKIERL